MTLCDSKNRKNAKGKVKVKVCGKDNSGDVISLLPGFQDQLLKTLPNTFSY